MDPYFILFIAIALASWGISALLNHRFKQYSKVYLPLTGREVAEKMLREGSRKVLAVTFLKKHVMRNLIKVKNPGLTKLNNREYLNLMTRTGGWIDTIGFAALGIEEEAMTRYNQLLEMLGNLVAHSYAQAETPEMAELEKQRDALGLYIIDNVRNAQNVTIANVAAAARALWPDLKPYEKFYSLPNQQETMMLDGMTRDLKSEKNAPYVATLGLTTFVDELEALNDRYEQLTTQRTSQRNAEKMPDGDTVRKEMDQLYDYITTVAFCESVAKPTQATAHFISELNAVIDEINALYNQRTGQTKKKDDETPLPPPSTDTEPGTTPEPTPTPDPEPTPDPTPDTGEDDDDEGGLAG